MKETARWLEACMQQIAARLGLLFDQHKQSWLLNLLSDRIKQLRTTPELYRCALENPEREAGEWKWLAQQLTVNETFFFRQIGHFEAFTNIVLPTRREVRSQEKQLTFASLGCSSGEEAYSLAILLHEQQVSFPGWMTEVVACDIHPGILEKAQQGIYSAWSLRALPSEYRQRYFYEEKNKFRLKDIIRWKVSFQELNLLEHAPLFWTRHRFDAIFCRNVLMYFTPEAMQLVVARLCHSLAPGGFLFLGHAETLRHTAEKLRLCYSHDGFYYQSEPAPASMFSVPAPRFFSSSGSTQLVSTRDETGVVGTTSSSSLLACDVTLEELQESVLHSSSRIAKIAQDLETRKQMPSSSQNSVVVEDRTGLTPAAMSPTSLLINRMESTEELSSVWMLLQQERFQEALYTLNTLEEKVPSLKIPAKDLAFLRSVLLFHCGDIEGSLGLCHDLLTMPSPGGVHLLMALCCEQLGRYEEALQHTRTAISFAPAFAMAHIFLGRLSRNQHAFLEAKTAFYQAIQLLPTETSSHLFLFGGGFHRDALIQLCRAEIQAMGDAT